MLNKSTEDLEKIVRLLDKTDSGQEVADLCKEELKRRYAESEIYINRWLGKCYFISSYNIQLWIHITSIVKGEDYILGFDYLAKINNQTIIKSDSNDDYVEQGIICFPGTTNFIRIELDKDARMLTATDELGESLRIDEICEETWNELIEKFNGLG